MTLRATILATQGMLTHFSPGAFPAEHQSTEATKQAKYNSIFEMLDICTAGSTVAEHTKL
jgi:hypothetical protein